MNCCSWVSCSAGDVAVEVDISSCWCKASAMDREKAPAMDMEGKAE